ncbi:hypothetical protein VTK26DRAFT_4443 [Humicola hyalothermophila]
MGEWTRWQMPLKPLSSCPKVFHSGRATDRPCQLRAWRLARESGYKRGLSLAGADRELTAHFPVVPIIVYTWSISSRSNAGTDPPYGDCLDTVQQTPTLQCLCEPCNSGTQPVWERLQSTQGVPCLPTLPQSDPLGLALQPRGHPARWLLGAVAKESVLPGHQLNAHCTPAWPGGALLFEAERLLPARSASLPSLLLSVSREI